VPPVLTSTDLPVPRPRAAAAPGVDCGALAPRDAAYWRDRLGDQDYTTEDRLDTERFNAELWRGRKADSAPPATGRDLRRNRAALLAAFRAQHGCSAGGMP
jgi:hypothetical protein